jgi:hypothetical protein
MHDQIYNFDLEGEVSDDNLVKSKEQLIRAVEDGMRDKNFIPVLDLDAQFTLKYNKDKELYDFKLTVYGVESEDSWNEKGIMYGKILKSSPKSKLKRSSTN